MKKSIYFILSAMLLILSLEAFSNCLRMRIGTDEDSIRAASPKATKKATKKKEVAKAKKAGKTAKRTKMQISFGLGLVANPQGTLYLAPEFGIKPVGVTFTVGNKKVTMSFLNSAVIARVVTFDPENGNEIVTNYFKTTLNSTSIAINKKFKIGMHLVRAQMRDSMNAWSVDWGQIYAAYNLVKKQGHALSLSVAPMIRSNFSYQSAGGGVNHQLWIPIKIGYSFKYKRLSLYSSVSYIPLQNFTTGGFANLFAFSAGADYRLTRPDSNYDVRIFLDGLVYLKKTAGSPITIYNQVALSRFMTGLRVRFKTW